MDTLIKIIEQEIQKNQFLSGGMLLMALGAIGVWCRNVPVVIYRRVSNFFWINFEVRSVDQTFKWLSTWLANLSHFQNRSRRLYLMSDYDGNFHLTPGFGTHWFFYKGRLIRLTRESTKDTESTESLTSTQKIYLSVLSRDRNIVYELLEEIKKESAEHDGNMQKVLFPRYGCWDVGTLRLKRSLSSVILNGTVAQDLLKDIRWFMSNRDWYVARGVPYRRGYLLHGPPGNGKSSLISALASELNLKIAVLNLSQSGMDDGKLTDLLSSVPENSCVVIEDVDCAWGDRDDKEGKKVTFSGLLNALDGFAAGEGHIVFMTTNHIEKLDPALIRPGRADIKMELRPPSREQYRKMFQQFYPEATSEQSDLFADNCQFENMAGVQGHLLSCSNPQDAIEMLPDTEEPVLLSH